MTNFNAFFAAVTLPLLLVVLFGSVGYSQDSVDYGDLMRTGDQRRARSDYRGAISKYAEASNVAKNDSQKGMAWGKQAEILAEQQQQWDRAEKLARDLLALPNADANARVIGFKVLARCQMHSKDFTGAISTLKAGYDLKVDWMEPTLMLMLGDCYRATEQHDRAIQVYRRATQLKKSNDSLKAIAYFNAGLTLKYNLQDPKKAKPFFEKAAELSPRLKDEVAQQLGLPKPRQRARRATKKRPLMLAHYMPWYAAKPAAEKWGWHWTMGHFDTDQEVNGKRPLASQYYPSIGPYDSGDRDVLEYHLLLMHIAGIDGVIVDWYGLSQIRDYPLLHRNTTRMLQQCEKMNMKFVICYEDQTVPALVKAGKLPQAESAKHVADEIRWLHKYWFQSPSYVKLNDSPLLLSFGHGGLTNEQWEDCLKSLELPLAYFSQGFRREGALGGFDWPSPKNGIQHSNRFLEYAQQWKAFIPSAYPRFHDIYREAGVGEGYPLIPDDEGKTFRQTLTAALDAKPVAIQLTTWNDWGEGTQIEPSQEFGNRDLSIVQQELKNRFGDSRFQPDDFDLPRMILELRRNPQVSTESVDPIVQLILAGETKEARERVAKIQRP